MNESIQYFLANAPMGCRSKTHRQTHAEALAAAESCGKVWGWTLGYDQESATLDLLDSDEGLILERPLSSYPPGSHNRVVEALIMLEAGAGTSLESLYNDVEELSLDPNSVLSYILEEDQDFEVDNFRFIHTDSIDKIQEEELGNDLYCLGCFNTDFLAGILNIDSDVLEVMQEAEAFEAIGKLVISLGKLEEVQGDYSSMNGYGHHFNHYDGNELEIGDYIAFQTS